MKVIIEGGIVYDSIKNRIINIWKGVQNFWEHTNYGIQQLWKTRDVFQQVLHQNKYHSLHFY